MANNEILRMEQIAFQIKKLSTFMNINCRVPSENPLFLSLIKV